MKEETGGCTQEEGETSLWSDSSPREAWIGAICAPKWSYSLPLSFLCPSFSLCLLSLLPCVCGGGGWTSGGMWRRGGHNYRGRWDGGSGAWPAEGMGRAPGCDSANATVDSLDPHPPKCLWEQEAGSQKPAPWRFWDHTTLCESEAALKTFHLVSALIFQMRALWSGEGDWFVQCAHSSIPLQRPPLPRLAVQQRALSLPCCSPRAPQGQRLPSSCFADGEMEP